VIQRKRIICRLREEAGYSRYGERKSKQAENAEEEIRKGFIEKEGKRERVRVAFKGVFFWGGGPRQIT